jgi:hypothetical protein
LEGFEAVRHLRRGGVPGAVTWCRDQHRMSVLGSP